MNKSLCENLQDIDYRNKHVKFSVCVSAAEERFMAQCRRENSFVKMAFKICIVMKSIDTNR